MSREYPCIYYDNQLCKKFSQDGYKSWCVLGPCSHEAPSNADRIRAMSDEELAKFLRWDICTKVRGDNRLCSGWCDECVLEWLKQPAKEDA